MTVKISKILTIGICAIMLLSILPIETIAATATNNSSQSNVYDFQGCNDGSGNYIVSNPDTIYAGNLSGNLRLIDHNNGYVDLIINIITDKGSTVSQSFTDIPVYKKYTDTGNKKVLDYIELYGGSRIISDIFIMSNGNAQISATFSIGDTEYHIEGITQQSGLTFLKSTKTDNTPGSEDAQGNIVRKIDSINRTYIPKKMTSNGNSEYVIPNDDRTPSKVIVGKGAKNNGTDTSTASSMSVSSAGGVVYTYGLIHDNFDYQPWNDGMTDVYSSMNRFLPNNYVIKRIKPSRDTILYDLTYYDTVYQRDAIHISRQVATYELDGHRWGDPVRDTEPDAKIAMASGGSYIGPDDLNSIWKLNQEPRISSPSIVFVYACYSLRDGNGPLTGNNDVPELANSFVNNGALCCVGWSIYEPLYTWYNIPQRFWYDMCVNGATANNAKNDACSLHPGTSSYCQIIGNPSATIYNIHV